MIAFLIHNKQSYLYYSNMENISNPSLCFNNDGTVNFGNKTNILNFCFTNGSKVKVGGK